VALVAAALVTVGLAAPVSVRSASAEPVATTSVPLMFVLDGSGSMATADAPGPRIDAAKKAIAQVVGALPPTARIGVMVYGTSTGSADSEKALGCADIKTLVPLGPNRRGRMAQALVGVTARGYTPIGRALRAAAAGLPAAAAASIVLVSDGIDTCAPPPPCSVAADLKAAHPDLTIHDRVPRRRRRPHGTRLHRTGRRRDLSRRFERVRTGSGAG
jgi:Ca-activated chloride channel family protein